MSLFSRIGRLVRREVAARWRARSRRVTQRQGPGPDPAREGGAPIEDAPADHLGQEAAQDPTLARYYANLELPYGADVEAVRESRRRLLKRYHPDLHSADPARKRTATTVAQGLNRAHDELLSRLDRKEQ